MYKLAKVPEVARGISKTLNIKIKNINKTMEWEDNYENIYYFCNSPLCTCEETLQFHGKNRIFGFYKYIINIL